LKRKRRSKGTTGPKRDEALSYPVMVLREMRYALTTRIYKNDARHSASGGVSQVANRCAAQDWGQLLTFEGKSCSLGRAFTNKRDRVMSNEITSESEKAQPLVYQIRIKGHFGRQWTDWFGGLTITLEDNGETLLTGPVVDQAALYGLLKKVRGVGMPLLSVIEVQFNENHRYHSKKGEKK
jgi:hypothetical protein